MSVISSRKYVLLNWEVTNIQNHLNEFEAPSNGERRIAHLGETSEYIAVRNFPLPDGYRPDYIDLLVITDDYPARPPIGLYILNKGNELLIRQIQERFNAFEDRAFHEAPAISRYVWICYHYNLNSWRYCRNNPACGDNVGKFLSNFFAELDR